MVCSTAKQEKNTLMSCSWKRFYFWRTIFHPSKNQGIGALMHKVYNFFTVMCSFFMQDSGPFYIASLTCLQNQGHCVQHCSYDLFQCTPSVRVPSKVRMFSHHSLQKMDFNAKSETIWKTTKQKKLAMSSFLGTAEPLCFLMLKCFPSS